MAAAAPKPAEVRSALVRLPGVAARILAAAPAVAPLPELQAASDVLLPLYQHAMEGRGGATFLFRDKAKLAALLKLLAATTRWPDPLGVPVAILTDMMVVAEAIVVLLAEGVLGNATCPPPAEAAAELCLGVVRAQALHGLARQVAALTAALKARAAAVQPSAPSPQQQRQRQWQQQRLTADEAVWSNALSKYVILLAMQLTRFAVQRGPFAARVEPELIAALNSSLLLEHVAPLVAHGGGNPEHAANLLLLRGLFERSKFSNCPAVAAGARAVVEGRCLQAVVLELGVATLCVYDGGPSHGLPAAVLAGRLGVLRSMPADCRMGHDAGALYALAEVLASPARVGPPGRRGAWGLLLRTVRLAVAAARAWAAEEAAGPSGAAELAGAPGGGRGGGGAAGGTPPRLVLSRVAAIHAVKAAHAALKSMPPPPPRHAVSLYGEWWRVYVEGVRLLLPRVTSADVDDLRPPPFEALPTLPGAQLPAEPPVTVATALAAGWLPCLERLLRRGVGADALGPELPLAAHALWGSGLEGGHSSHLGPLLAYGEPRHAASLLTTLAKVLRRGTVAPLALQLPRGTPWWLLHRVTLNLACAAAVRSVSAAGAAAAARQAQQDQGAAVRRQLGLLTSFAAAAWLPPQSEYIMDMLQYTRDADR